MRFSTQDANATMASLVHERWLRLPRRHLLLAMTRVLRASLQAKRRNLIAHCRDGCLTSVCR